MKSLKIFYEAAFRAADDITEVIVSVVQPNTRGLRQGSSHATLVCVKSILCNLVFIPCAQTGAP